jgi:hypothetical protein
MTSTISNLLAATSKAMIHTHSAVFCLTIVNLHKHVDTVGDVGVLLLIEFLDEHPLQVFLISQLYWGGGRRPAGHV